MLNPNAPRRLMRGGVILLFGCAFFCAAVARADDVEDAQKLLRAGQSQQALERVNKALAANPKEPQARFLKGVILTEQGKQPEAIEIFTRLTQDYPNLPEPYNNLAVIYAAQGQYEKARTSLEQSIRTHPTYATAYENLGDVYAKLASQAYGKALQLDASNTAAQNKLSLVRELVREPAETPKAAAPAATVAAVAPEKPAADASGDVVKALSGWAQAWSKKDANGYLAYYAPDFKTPAGESRSDWEKTRRERIAAAKSISVAIESPKVTMRDAQQASVSFRQTYKSDKLTSKNRKTLELVKVDNRWLIREEKAGK
jgi:tetratricopeptide (TPR) repeat protein